MGSNNGGLVIGISSREHSVESTAARAGSEKSSIGFDLWNGCRGIIDEEGSSEYDFLSSYV